MARRPKVIAVTSTAYCDGVTPLWVPPNQPSIDPRYHDAIHELAKWAGPNWVNNEDTFFFPIRRKLIRVCERWRSHDWKSDVDLIKERREDANHLPELERAFSLFLSALKKAQFNYRKQALGLVFMAELCPDTNVNLTNEEANNAIERAVEGFRQHLKIRDSASAQYGPVEYESLPRQLPEREIAVALSLAVSITVWRRDGLAEGDHILWQKAVISRNLPWKSIALFAWANAANGEWQIDAKDAQKRVTSLAKKVMRVDLRSNG
jgi:hypothetical protein